MIIHQPVLLKEVLKIFDPSPGETYIDATINGGGHAEAILQKIGPEGKLLGIDWDCGLLKELRTKNLELRNKNIKLICDNYVNVKSNSRKYHLGEIAGILFDLGFSSYHLEESRRGFSFLKAEPLDMRYNPDGDLTAEKIINTWAEKAIADLLWQCGEERFARRIARGIVRARAQGPIRTTVELNAVISRSVPRAFLGGRLHPATRTYQALRMTVNQELENLERVLPEATDIIKKKGKLIVISFHSLEDRIVKKFFRQKEREGILEIITPKPISPGLEEINNNPRARSAKLRAAIKI